MEMIVSKKGIEFEKELNELDSFVISFCSVLNRLKIKYVLISGYVSILFGRNRASEDVDIFIEKLNAEKFSLLWDALSENFECLIKGRDSAYNEYLLNSNAIRFAKKNEFIPNMELKFPKSELDKLTLAERVKVKVNNDEIYISPIEIQIPFKLLLGSEKDIEDAKYLYEIFKDKLNMEELQEVCRKLKIVPLLDKYLR